MSERVIFFKVTQDEECTSTHGTRKSLDPGVLELLLTLEYCCPHWISLNSSQSHEGKVNEGWKGRNKRSKAFQQRLLARCNCWRIPREGKKWTILKYLNNCNDPELFFDLGHGKGQENTFFILICPSLYYSLVTSIIQVPRPAQFSVTCLIHNIHELKVLRFTDTWTF